MGFNRQLEVFLAIVATLITFMSCAIQLELSIMASVLISLCVLLAGLVFGRSISEILLKILG
jgi:biotin transporter BioY